MEPKLSKGKIIVLTVLGVLVIIALWFFSAYNSLISLSENVKTAQSQIEVDYQRRFDLIPNIVASVQGIVDQERAVFTALAEARSRYAGAAAGTPDKVAALNQVETSLSRLLVIVENYPDLRSSENFLRMQDELAGTENRIAVSRSRYNESVNSFNKKVQFFPSNIVAGIFGFSERERFQATEAAATSVPKVDIEVK